MAPRTRRAATTVQKQSQYRISDDDDDDDDVSTVPEKKKVGGVLASLSHNIPAVKSHKGNSKAAGFDSKSGTESTIYSTKDVAPKQLLAPRTPQPPSSVTVGARQKMMSPLTLPRVSKSTAAISKRSVDDVTMDDDGISAVSSCDVFSPAAPRQTRTSKRSVFEDDASSDDSDKTEEMSLEGMQEDPDETILEESDEDEEQSEVEEEQSEVEEEQSEVEESEDDYESESESELDHEESSEPEDDEYNPEEDADSCSEEDLDEYVEEEVEEKPSRSRKQRDKTSAKEQKSKSSETTHVKQYIDTTGDVEESTSYAEDQTGLEVSLDEIVSEQTMHGAIGMQTEVDYATDTELTPAKPRAQTFLSMDLASPEPQVAVILDDDELDDDDDDVLVATILEVDFCGKPGVPSTSQEPNISYSRDDDEDDLDDEQVYTQDGSSTKTSRAKNDNSSEPSVVGAAEKKEQAEKEHSGHCDPLPSSDNSRGETTGSGEVMKSTAVDINLSTPKNTRRKSRKSFFRLEGAIKRGKWTLGTKIGVGSFGIVHVGMNNESGKLMAVKKFEVEGAIMKDIRTEVELMRSLDHSNIVRYLGAQMDKTHLHIFQEWVPGGSVVTLLSRFGPFTIKVIRSYLSQTLSGLAYLHENDIMHRDIKGSNILVNDAGIVKLADFGASKKLANLQDNLMMSMSVRGTPYFMAPEVFEEKYSSKADIWGIGCVAFQMITGSPPWKDKGFSNPISLFNHIKNHDGPPPVDDANANRLASEDKNIHYLLKDFVRKCFLKDPASRPTGEKLLEHSFFTEMHDDADDDTTYSRGLFSPGNDTVASLTPARSADMDSQLADSPSPSPMHFKLPSPKSHSRSKSVVQWKTTFASPPRPKRSAKKRQTTPFRSSPRCSPKSDTSDWPNWAQAELQKRNLFDKSPRKSEVLPSSEENSLSGLMGSLALSEDTGFASQNPYRRASQSRTSTIGTTQSNLVGLNLLDGNSATFEI